MLELVTPEVLKSWGNLVVIILMLVGLYKLAYMTVTTVVKPVAEAWVDAVFGMLSALNGLTEQLSQLHKDHEHITEYLGKLNGKT